PPENFFMELYPGGLALTDFVDLTFWSKKYLEAWDGAGGFAIPLLLPAGILAVAAAGSPQSRFVALTSLLYVALILLNMRYLRYIFPAFPLIAVLLVYPIAAAKGTITRAIVVLLAIIGIALDVGHIPAGGWILHRFDPLTTFSPNAKKRAVEAD